MSDESKIKLFLFDQTAFVWNSEDWLKIRSHRIMGNFVGNLAALPRQDFFAGLPLALSPEETTLLLEEKLAILVRVSNITDAPDEAVKSKSQSLREQTLAEQIDICRNLRKKEIEGKIDIIVEGKLAKQNSSFNRNDPEYKQKILQEEVEKIQPPSLPSLGVQIFTEDPWVTDEDCINCEWTYPSSDKEKLSYMTFLDLWRRGFYVTSGGKFGADYLAYLGDPLRFHAQFIVKCMDKTIMKPKEIIACGRLGQSVRKTVVLSYFSEDNQLCFQSVQWTGQ